MCVEQSHRGEAGFNHRGSAHSRMAPILEMLGSMVRFVRLSLSCQVLSG